MNIDWEKWSQIIEQCPWGIALGLPNSDKLHIVNKAYADMHGYQPQEMVNLKIASVFYQEDQDVIPQAQQSAETMGEFSFSAQHIRKDKTVFPAFHRIKTVMDSQGVPALRIVNVWDESDQQTRDRLFQTLLEEIPFKTGDDYYFSVLEFLCNELNVKYGFIGKVNSELTKVNTKMVYQNHERGDNFEYDLKNTPCEHVVGKEACFYPGDIQKLFPKDYLLVEMGVHGYSGIPIFTSEGTPLGLIVILDDKPLSRWANKRFKSILTIFAGRISFEMERETYMDKITASLEEKNVLIKEIHHRVKNNLALASSLLALHSEMIENTSLKDILKDSQNRIISMALIHERLYESDNFSRILISEYIEKLVLSIIEAYYSVDDMKSLEFDLAPITLSIEQLQPLGLIINELVTNTLKHARQDISELTLRVSLKLQKGKTITLEVADNGLPDTGKAKEGLGLSLVDGLVMQLNGEYTQNSNNGWLSQVTFDRE